MASQSDTRVAPCAHASNLASTHSGTFEPAAWLAEFAAVGGAFALTDSGLHLWTLPGAHSVDEQDRARRLVSRITHDQHAALKDHLSAQVGESDSLRSSIPEAPRIPRDAGSAGDQDEGIDHMNMMTRFPNDTARAGRFLDEDAKTSERSGPDLTKAEPIADVIARLAPLRNGYSTDLLAACKASGIDVTVLRNRDGVDGLQFGYPCDGQERLRMKRGDALAAQMKRGKFRRQQVIDHLNLIGRFMDNQRFASPAEWAAAFLDRGGRLSR